MTKDKLIVLDLEATCSHDNRISRSNMETIEIGVAVVQLETFEMIDTFQLYIHPVVTPTLTNFCTELTGIAQETVDGAQTFGMAIENYRTWLASFTDMVAWCSWGNYDKGQLELDYARHNVTDLHMNLPHFNLKNMFGEAVQQKRMGLGRAIKYVGAKFEGRAHSGVDDAINISRLFTLAPSFGDLIKKRIYYGNN